MKSEEKLLLIEKAILQHRDDPPHFCLLNHEDYKDIVSLASKYQAPTGVSYPGILGVIFIEFAPVKTFQLLWGE